MVCHSHANKTYFDKKDCSDSTWPHLEVQVFVTSRKWPDRTVAYFIALRLRLHFQISSLTRDVMTTWQMITTPISPLFDTKNVYALKTLLTLLIRKFLSIKIKHWTIFI